MYVINLQALLKYSVRRESVKIQPEFPSRPYWFAFSFHDPKHDDLYPKIGYIFDFKEVEKPPGSTKSGFISHPESNEEKLL